MLRRVRKIGDMAQISYVRQKEQLGLGHAVLMAKELVGHEPFAVILSDDVVTGERSCVGQLVEAYQRTGGSSRRGHAGPARGDEPLRRRRPRSRVAVADDAPAPHPRRRREAGAGESPSDLAIIGRYVLTPKIFEKLEQTQRGAGGEIQLTDAIEALMKEQ